MADQERIRSLSIYDQIDERFTRGQVPAVVSFIQNLTFPISMAFNGTDGLESAIKNDADAVEYKDDGILYDYGDGRVSKGMRGLELLAKLCKGVNPNDLYLFNNVIYSSDPESIKNASDDELINIVINNLGMFDVVNRASAVASGPVTAYRALCLRVGQQVRSGVYRRGLFAAQIRHQSRKLVAIAARANLIRGNLL